MAESSLNDTENASNDALGDMDAVVSQTYRDRAIRKIDTVEWKRNDQEAFSSRVHETEDDVRTLIRNRNRRGHFLDFSPGATAGRHFVERRRKTP